MIFVVVWLLFPALTPGTAEQIQAVINASVFPKIIHVCFANYYHHHHHHHHHHCNNNFQTSIHLQLSEYVILISICYHHHHHDNFQSSIHLSIHLCSCCNHQNLISKKKQPGRHQMLRQVRIHNCRFYYVNTLSDMTIAVQHLSNMMIVAFILYSHWLILYILSIEIPSLILSFNLRYSCHNHYYRIKHTQTTTSIVTIIT